MPNLFELIPEPADPEEDLCGQYQGRYLDVVHNAIKNTWSGLYGERRVVFDKPTRYEARQALLEWVSKNSSGE